MPLSVKERKELETLGAQLEQRQGYKIRRYFQETGEYRRALYPKHLEWMAAGAQYRERLFLKANRVGGTEMGSFELTLHLTGAYDEYAPWWQGRRFHEPIKAWAAGDTGKTTRDILQEKLIGPEHARGTGMLPKHLIKSIAPKAGLPGAIENVSVHHVSGGRSLLQLKSYDQRREAFQGTSQHVVWLDEECDVSIYTECLLRTAETSDFPGGIIMLTFTPLMGLSELVLQFLPGGKIMGTTA